MKSALTIGGAYIAGGLVPLILYTLSGKLVVGGLAATAAFLVARAIG